MAEEINSNLVSIVKYPELPALALAINNIFAHTNSSGFLGRASFGDVATFLAPYISAVGASGLVFPAGGTPNVLPNPAGSGVFATILGAGTYTQSGGAAIVATGLINILSRAGGVWTLVKEIFLEEIEYKISLLKPFFPFQDKSAKVWFDAFGGLIVDVYLSIPRNPALFYSFHFVRKTDTDVTVILYSTTDQAAANKTAIGQFVAVASNGYVSTSMEPLMITDADLGAIVIIPGAIANREQDGLVYGLLGLDTQVFSKNSKYHGFINNLTTVARMANIETSTNPKFPFWFGADPTWYNTFKSFLLDVNLFFTPNPALYYSFAIIQKNPTTVVLSLYSATDQGSTGANKIADFGSNVNLGYKPDSKEPFEITNEFGSIIISPGSIPTTNQAALFYVLNGLDSGVFTTNNKRNAFIRDVENKKGLLKQPKVNWSTILNLMMFKGVVVMEFIGDSIVAGVGSTTITFPQAMYDAVIDAYKEYAVTPGVSPLQFSILNKGEGGTTTRRGKEIIGQNTGNANVTFMMSMYNDCRYNIPDQFVPLPEYKENLRFMVRTAIDQGKLPILGIEPNISTSFQTGILTGYRNANLEVGEEFGCLVWDFTQQIWDIQDWVDGLHFNDKTYFGMGWDLAGLFTTMNYFNNIRPSKGDEISARHNAENVCGDGIKINHPTSATGEAFALSQGETLSFAFDLRENVSLSVKVINTLGGTTSAPFSVHYYGSLNTPLPTFIPTGGSQEFSVVNIKAGKRLINIRNEGTTQLVIESIKFN